MHVQKKFAVTFTVSESSAGKDLDRIFQGWGRVTSFGRTHFSKTILTDEGLGVVTALSSLGLDYELSMGRGGSRYGDRSLLALTSAQQESLKQLPAERNAEPPPKREILASRGRRSSHPPGGGLPLRWALATFGVFLLVGFTITEIVENRRAATAFTALAGLYEDDFTDNRYGWPINGTADIHSGGYLIDNLDSDKGILISNERLVGGSSVAEASVTLVEGAKSSFAGLASRVRNNENFYFFGVALDGSVAIIKRELGFWRRLLPGGGIRRSPDKGGRKTEHRLKIVCKGIYMEFYLDGELLTVVRDDSFEEGCLGFYVDKNLNAIFDDLLVVFNQHESFDPEDPFALR